MIHITDFNGNIIDFISREDGAVTEAEHMINVEDKLETFDFTILTSRTGNLQKRNRILITDKDGQYREFIIYNISSDLNGYTRVQTNASALEDIKTAKPVGPHKLDKHTVKQALEYALADTGWKVSDEAEWGGTRTTSWTGWHDRISILKQLETTYDMRVSFYVEVGSNKVAKRYVSLNKVEPLFKGEEIVYGDNMIDLKRTVDFSDIATALICLGPEDSETGKREIVEIKDDDAQSQFGLPYRYIWDIYEPQSSDEKMTRQRLTTLGRTALNKRKQESISYEIDGIGLTASAGDMIRVKNEDFTPELYVDAEVVEVTTDLISGDSKYKFGVIKEYTRDDVYARFNAMLSGLRERLNKVVENTDSIISERLEEELKYVERYIEKSPTPPLNAKEGQLWLDLSHDVAVLKRYENGEWVKSSVSNVKEIGGMTREETMYESLKERLVRNEVDYSEVFKRHRALVSEKQYHYVDEDIKNDLTSRYNSLQKSYDDFKIAFNNINTEQPTIGLITTAISRAVEFESRLKEYNDSYYVARKAFDEVIALLQSQYSDEKYNELLNEIADSVGGIVNDDGSIDMTEEIKRRNDEALKMIADAIGGTIDENGNIDTTKIDKQRLDEAMELVASAIGGTWNGNQLIADVPNREELNDLNKSIKRYLNGELSSLDGKLGKHIETVVNQAKDEFRVAIESVDKKVDGIEIGGRNLLLNSNQRLNKPVGTNYATIPNFTFKETGTYTISFNAIVTTDENSFDRHLIYVGRSVGSAPRVENGRTYATFTIEERDLNKYMFLYLGEHAGISRENGGYFEYLKIETGNKPTDWSPAPEDFENDINNLTQEVSKNTTSLNLLENEISLKADSNTVKQILDDELEPIKSSVQSNKAELKVQSDLIGSKVDSATYEVDKDGIVKDIETNASAIEQTSKSLTSNIDSVNKRIDEQDSIIDTNKSSISQLNNQIALKVDSEYVKQTLDEELKVVKSDIGLNKSELKVLENQISSKVESAEYTKDKDDIIKNIEANKSEITQTAKKLSSDIQGVDTKVDEQTRVVNTNSSNIEQLNNQISLKASTTEVKELLNSELKAVKSNVATNQSQLKLLSNQISSKVESSKYTTDMNGITRDIKNTKSEVSQLSESVNSKITSVEQKFDELEVGGRNLVRNSDFSKKFDKPWYVNGKAERVLINGLHVIKVTEKPANGGIYTYPTELENGEIYTISFYAKAINKTSSIKIGFLGQPNGRSKTFLLDEEMKRYTFTTTQPLDKSINSIMHMYGGGTSTFRDGFYITKIKLEKGNKATDWTPAPEDYQTQIDKQGNILTKHETEIEQNKLGLNTKVGYTEMNGTQRTLEKLLTEFSQTSSGFNFKIDSNGMIQDLTFDRYRFKLNSNLIEFNNGDVVIKDGKTTIKDAFIHDLASNNAFINVLNSQYINSNEVTSEVGGNKTIIRGGYFESSGTYRRSWLGRTTTNNVSIRVESGYLRFRNNTLGGSIYMSDYGISTMRDATGDYLDMNGSSGSLIFFDTRYSYDNQAGITLHSYGGTASLVSETYHALVKSKYSTSIEVTDSLIMFKPYSESRIGSNIFKMTLANASSASHMHGYLTYGSDNDPHAVGLRFSKTKSNPIIQVVDYDFSTGGDTSIEAGNGLFNEVNRRSDNTPVYWNGTSTGTINQGRVSSTQLIASSIVSRYGDKDIFLGTRSGGTLRITDENGYNSGKGITYRDINFQNWKAWSSESAKTEIEKWDLKVLDIIKDELQLYRYKFKKDIGTEYSKFNHGIILRNNSNEDEFPVEWRDEDAFNGNEVMWWNTKAIQELAHENDELKSEIKELNNKINKIMEMIA